MSCVLGTKLSLGMKVMDVSSAGLCWALIVCLVLKIGLIRTLTWLDGTQFDLALLVHHFHAGLGAWLALQKVQPDGAQDVRPLLLPEPLLRIAAAALYRRHSRKAIDMLTNCGQAAFGAGGGALSGAS